MWRLVTFSLLYATASAGYLGSLAPYSYASPYGYATHGFGYAPASTSYANVYKAHTPSVAVVKSYVKPVAIAAPKISFGHGLDYGYGHGLDYGYGLGYGYDHGLDYGFGKGYGHGLSYGYDHGLDYSIGHGLGYGLGNYNSHGLNYGYGFGHGLGHYYGGTHK